MFTQVKTIFSPSSSIYGGSLVSAIMLVGFMVLQSSAPGALALDSRWLIVTGIPLLIALIVGGHIKNIKGLGIELETRLQDRVNTINLDEAKAHSVTDAVAETHGMSKGGPRELLHLSEQDSNSITRLKFVSGRDGYYAVGAISEYLTRLPNMAYFEIVDTQNRFQCLLPVTALIQQSQRSSDVDEIIVSIDNSLVFFINALSQNQITTTFASSVVTLTISNSSSMVDALKKLHEQNERKAAVVDDSGIFVGLVHAHEIERRIAENVIRTKFAR